MPSEKGLSNTVWIIAAVLVALVIALILMGSFTSIFRPVANLSQQIASGDTCSDACRVWQSVCVEGSSKPYSQFPGCMKTGVCKCETGVGNRS